MGSLRRSILLVCVVCFAAGTSGCARVFHELQFHRLWRMNRGPGMSSDVYYSLPAEPTIEPADASRPPVGAAADVPERTTWDN